MTQIPLTRLEGKTRRVRPFEILLPEGVAGAEWASIAMPQQVRAIDKALLLEKIGSLHSPSLRRRIEDRIPEPFGIAFILDQN